MKDYSNHYIVLYDGDCGFCNFWVQWILKIDRKHIFYFSALQSDFGQAFLLKHNKSTVDLDTIYLISPEGQFYKKLDAVINIARQIGGLYKVLNILKVVPRIARDTIYDFIAKHRKKILKHHCYLPSPEERLRFLK